MWNWTLPAWAGRLPDGRTYNTCPSAGVCAQVCYARHGTYRWPQVKAKHQANLRFVLDDPDGWEAAMVAELGARRFHGAWIRIHDFLGQFKYVSRLILGDLWKRSVCRRGLVISPIGTVSRKG